MVQLGQHSVAAKSTSSDLAMLDGSLMTVPSQLRLFVVLLAGTSLYTDRRLHLSLIVKTEKTEHHPSSTIVRWQLLEAK